MIDRPLAAFAAAVIGLGSAAAHALPISSVSTNDTSLSYTLVDDGFGEGVDAFSDSSETWTSTPALLAGADYVLTGQGDNSNSDLEVTITFGEEAELYVFHADSIADPSWLSTDFTALSETVSLSGPVSGDYTVYRSLSSFMSGDSYTLLDNDPATGNTGLMYGIAALATGGDGGDGGTEAPIPVPAAGLLLLTAVGAAGVGLRRRR